MGGTACRTGAGDEVTNSEVPECKEVKSAAVSASEIPDPMSEHGGHDPFVKIMGPDPTTEARVKRSEDSVRDFEERRRQKDEEEWAAVRRTATESDDDES